MENPFEGLEAAFAADLEPVRYDFLLHNLPCYVVLRPMDAGAMSAYRSAGRRVNVDVKTRALEEVRVDVDHGASEMALLLGSVVDFQLARKKVATTGEEVFEHTTQGSRLSKQAREQIFRDLSTAFRDRLVQLCEEVNAFRPLGPAAVEPSPGTPE